MEWIGIVALVISLVALGVGVWQMYMSRSRYRELKADLCELKKDHDDLKGNDRIILGHLHREFGLRLKGSTTFDSPEMTATVEVMKGKKDVKKPTFLLTLRRFVGKLFP